MRFRTRWTGDERDSDLFESLTLRWRDPERDPVSGSLGVRFAQDLDAQRHIDGYYPFDSLDDTRDRAATARLYTAYLDWTTSQLRLRGGRQILEEIPEAIPMDGGLMRVRFSTVDVAVFGGLPVNLFEPSTSGDWMYGGWISVAPLRIEYLHLRDETAFGEFDDDFFAGSFEERIGPFLFFARYTLLEGESRDLNLRVTGALPQIDLIVDGQLTYLFRRQEAHSYALDPYSVFLIEQVPYVQWSFRAAKGFGGNLALDASITGRELVENEDESAYNHAFLRVNATPRLMDWPLKRFSMSVPVDWWKTKGDGFWSVGGDISWDPRPDLSLAVGSSYALYTIDSVTGEERERVRSLYVSGRWRLVKETSLTIRASLDQDNEDTWGTLELGVRHSF